VGTRPRAVGTGRDRAGQGSIWDRKGQRTSARTAPALPDHFRLLVSLRFGFTGTPRAHSITRQLSELRTKRWCPFTHEIPASRLAGRPFPVSSIRGRMTPCLRSLATHPATLALLRTTFVYRQRSDRSFRDSIDSYYVYRTPT
jgi:hypothetical protein